MSKKEIVTVYDEVVNIEGKIFVWFTDKFLSGWGCSDGKICKQVVICDDWFTAERIYDNLNRRKDEFCVKNVSFGRKLPNLSRYVVSYRLASACPAWLG